jgi:hypothetical protein
MTDGEAVAENPKKVFQKTGAVCSSSTFDWHLMFTTEPFDPS